MFKKLYKITVCAFLALFLSILITLGLMFTKYYEYFISDLVGPGWGFWIAGAPLLVESFVRIFGKGLFFSWMINSFRQKKFSFPKLFAVISILFFSQEVINNFGSIHFKRLCNLKSYLTYVENNPKREQSVSEEKLLLLTLDLVKVYVTELDLISDKALPYEVQDDSIDVLMGNKKFDNIEAYDDLMNLIQKDLSKIQRCRQELKAFEVKFSDEQKFREVFKNSVNIPKFWNKIPPVYQDLIISEDWFPKIKDAAIRDCKVGAELIELIYELNEKYLSMATLLKDQFNYYKVTKENIIFDDEASSMEYDQIAEQIQRLTKEIEIKAEEINKEAQIKKESMIKKRGAEWVENVEKHMNN